MSEDEKQRNIRVLELRKLVPSAVRTAMKKLNKPYKLKNSKGEMVLTELAGELTSVADMMLVDQYPAINEKIVTDYLHQRLKDWYLDNQTIVAVKAATNRKRQSRVDRYLIDTPALHDPRECPNGVPKGREYANQEAIDFNTLLSMNGRYTPECDDYLYSVAEEEIDQVHKFFDYLYVFVAEDETDRAIIAYLRSKFDPSRPQVFLELGRLSDHKIADAIGSSKSTVTRRLAAMKQRVPKPAA